MAKDHSLALRQAIVTALRADAGVSAIAGARVYGMQVPDGAAWPFIRYGAPLTSIYESSCSQGSDSDVTLHAFAKGPGEDDCAELAAAVADALASDNLPLADGLGLVSLDWISTQILEYPEEDGFRAVIRFQIVTEE
ncbi:DUF3168 domain-containing protein [Marinicauda sp. Alg238-R41]|uniref:DUF3168 domain-containing protein n=1 Tax=Marinicauda sp. Alg238-R41 TaxID=2993447 RepID=UPI0022E85BB8|nr:DUF3168 domain-containing protein [Marinicauda sp. Alg238-R41]